MRSKTIATASSVTLLGTAAVAQTVTYDFDRAANFARFRTYARASSPELRSSERYSAFTRRRGIPSSLRTTTYSLPILCTTTSGTM